MVDSFHVKNYVAFIAKSICEHVARYVLQAHLETYVKISWNNRIKFDVPEQVLLANTEISIDYFVSMFKAMKECEILIPEYLVFLALMAKGYKNGLFLKNEITQQDIDPELKTLVFGNVEYDDIATAENWWWTKD